MNESNHSPAIRHQRSSKVALLVGVALLAPALLLGAGPAAAQAQLARQLTVKVRPGMNAQFEEAVRALRDVSRKEGTKNYWLVSQTMSGEPLYIFNSTGSSFGDFAQPGPQVAKVLGEAEAKRIGELAAASIESTSSAFYRPQPELSHVPAPGTMTAPPVAIGVFYISINPGMQAQYLEGTRKSREASMAVAPKSYFQTSLPAVGATGPRTVVFYYSWAELDSPGPGVQQRVTRHFGAQEGARINESMGKAIGGFDMVLARTRPDLNYQPAQ